MIKGMNPARNEMANRNVFPHVKKSIEDSSQHTTK